MLLKNGLICDYSRDEKADIRIEDGKIVQMASSLSAKVQEQEIDCQGKLIAPALIDLSVYPKAKTLSQKTLTSLSQKSIKGGIGSVLILPDTTPACENEAMIELIKSIDSITQINLIPSIKPINSENKINDIAILNTQGGRAIYIDSSIDGNNLLRITQYCQMLGIPLICFAQDIELGKGVINQGELASILGLPSIPPLAQTKEVARFCETARYMGISLLFNAITEPNALEIIDYFRSQGSQIATQTSIHHLILDENACSKYNTKAKLNPPLKDLSSVQKLLEALKSEKIDMLTSLQCADYNSKKDQVFELASFGIDAASYYFPLAYTHLVESKIITLQELLRLTSKNPSDFLSLNKGSLDLGKDADLMIVDLKSQIQIQDVFSPYHNQILNSQIAMMILGGKICG